MPDLDVDQLINNIETHGSAEGEKPQATPNVEASPDAQQASPAPVVQGFTFKSPEELYKHKLKYAANGKEIEEDISTILRRAGQGYNWAQKNEALNVREAEWQTKVKTAEEQSAKWGPYDEYAKQNPEWYNHWQNAWNNRGQNLTEPQTSDGNLEQKLQTLLEERLKPVNELLSHHEQQKLQAKVQGEDQALEQQMKSIRETHKDIDFDFADPESGKTLEYKIIEFGVRNNIKDFGVAFKAFYHDELVKREREKVKDELAKSKVAQTKAGIVDQRSATGNRPQQNLKSLSWDQIAKQTADEYGFT